MTRRRVGSCVHPTHVVVRGSALLVAAMTSGCGLLVMAAAERSGVEDRARRDLGCAEVTVTSIGAGGYEARGCGGVATYVCAPAPSRMGATCVREDEPRRPPAAASQRASEPAEPRELTLSVRMASDVGACNTAAEAVVLRAQFGRDGRIARLDGPATDDVRACAYRVLRLA
ncbi:MAG: hypothetical protein IT379_06480, partial [Deltaproteobacteria bacterium]|nr:hypothetical protein [Deltaproteobacteria bacterium]